MQPSLDVTLIPMGWLKDHPIYRFWAVDFRNKIVRLLSFLNSVIWRLESNYGSH